MTRTKSKLIGLKFDIYAHINIMYIYIAHYKSLESRDYTPKKRSNYLPSKLI